MDHEIEPVSLGRDTPSKKRKFHYLQDLLLKAFNEDKEEFDRSVLSSSRGLCIDRILMPIFSCTAVARRGHANLLCIVPILSDVPEGTTVLSQLGLETGPEASR